MKISSFAKGMIFGALLLAVFVQPAGIGAQYGYGGAPAAEISVDKLVSVPGNTSQFVDNLSVSDIRFKAGQDIAFKIKVRNTSNVKLTNIKLEDFVPGTVTEVTPLSGGNANRNVFTADSFDLDPGQEREFILKGKIAPQNQLPADRGLFCELNRARATSGNLVDEDTAQFCIEKEVAGVPGAPAQRVPQQVPQAGPEAGILLAAGQLGLLGTGIYLRRRNRLK